MNDTDWTTADPRHLTVRNFSCIDYAEMTFPALTFITGAQGSGKSLISKIMYFCQRIPDRQLNYADEGLSKTEYIEKLSSEFAEWFPPSAWGAAAFSIIYRVGVIEVTIRRRKGRGALKESVQIVLSDYLIDHYDSLQEVIRHERSRVRHRTSEHSIIASSQIAHFVRRASEEKLIKELGTAYTLSQTFVPAGRAFFTSVGKAIAAFEQGRMFDPITATFGKLFVSVREQMRYGWPPSYRMGKNGPDATKIRSRQAEMSSLFGGKLRVEKDDLFVDTPDGRRVPLSALSSGQQELLPLWLSLEYFEELVQFRDKRSGADFIYIEEPEAHLFPTSQAALIQYLVTLVNANASKARMIITTHSPYFLAKANNLIKAGALGCRKRQPRQALVSSVIPKAYWLPPKTTAAYAIDNRVVSLITDSDGLIDGGYLDSVSEDVLSEYERLVDVLYGQN